MPPKASFIELIERAGLTREDVADLVGCEERTVYRWERGEVRPKKVVTDMLEKRASERAAESGDSERFTYIDLFAGIGGMRLAFDSIGGRCVATCEWNKYARKTYAANFPIGSHPFYEDICEVTKDEELIHAMPDHDILVAGFPCQPFSIAGVSKKNSLGNAHGFACETQGTLFFELAKIIQIKKPKAFLLENVKNLVSHDKGNTFRVIIAQCQSFI